MTAEVAAIEFDGVDFAFGDVPVLSDITMNVAAGEFLALIGPNGGGKSTFVRLALGLLKPRRGKVTVLGTTPREASPRIGYVPQFATFPRDWPISVGDVVLHGRLGRRAWWRRLDAGDRRAAEAAMVATEVHTLTGRPIASLSGGQLQRVLVARALATEPELLLLDEPTAHVDTRAELGLFDLLAALHRKMTVVVVSHDVGLVSCHVDRIACLNRRLVCHAPVPLDAGVLEQLYGMPMRLVDHGHGPRAAARAP